MPDTLPITRRHLGSTDVEVTPIGLGVMQFSGGRGPFGLMFPDLSQDQMNTIIQAALDGGINWFDTAEMYGLGRSEQALAKALHAAGKTPADVVVATKWLPLLRTAGNIPRTIDNRLRYLSGYPIDLYMVHQPWSFSSVEAEMDAMAGLVHAGKIRTIGVSNFTAQNMWRAHAALAKHGLPLAANQMQYSLLHRKIETDGVLDMARQLGVTIIAYTPLGAGILGGQYHRNPELLDSAPRGRRVRLRRLVERSRPLVEALEAIAPRYAATPAQVALNWVINFQGDTVVAIPGATKVSQAADSAGAMRFQLSAAELSQLDELSRTFR